MTEEAHQERFFSSVDGSRWRFLLASAPYNLYFSLPVRGGLAGHLLGRPAYRTSTRSVVVDQQPICWAGQPTETSTRFFIKPPKQRSTMFVLRLKTLRQGLSGGEGKTE